MCQLSQRVGDLAGNAEQMLEWRARAAAEGAELVMVPELQLTGYPPEDLVLKPEFVRQTMETAERLVDATATAGPALLFGSDPRRRRGEFQRRHPGRAAGKIVGRTLKHELPNYGTFDEKRVFAHGPLPEPILFKGRQAGRSDLRGYMAGIGLRPPRQGRGGDAAGAQRQPL